MNIQQKFLSFIVFVVFFSNISKGDKIKDSIKQNSVMKIVFISDTHGRHHEIDIPGGDFLIFCGDMCPRGSLSDIEEFSSFLKELPHKHKIVIAGNHDKPFEDERKYQAEEIITSSGVIYLNDSGVEIEQVKIWGSPIQPWFLNWAFNKQRGEEIKKHWDMIPLDTDLLITHGPPYGILDQNDEGKKLGCKDLFKKVKKVNPKVHAFGHIHESYGKVKKNKTTFINASNLNGKYKYTNPPIVLKKSF